MIKLSLCMIVKNEQEVLGRCLDSVCGIFDEIIIVDTGSHDNTKLIASQYTDKVYDFKWVDDFSAARNYSFSKATMQYVMWLDADDIIMTSDRELLLAFKSKLSFSVDVVMMKYNVAFDEDDLPVLSYYRERIMKRSNNFKWISPIHETVETTGKVEYSNIAISHKKLSVADPDRNINIFEKMIASGEILDARGQFYYARELYYHERYQEAIDKFNFFLNEGKGWIENNISACQDLANCYTALKDDRAALVALLRSLTYDVPRAEICCKIGKYFFEVMKYQQSIFWYNMATTIEIDYNNKGFISPDCYGFIPEIQMCVCYDRLGDYENALKCHERTKLLKPNNSSVKINEEYFRKKLPCAKANK